MPTDMPRRASQTAVQVCLFIVSAMALLGGVLHVRAALRAALRAAIRAAINAGLDRTLMFRIER